MEEVTVTRAPRPITTSAELELQAVVYDENVQAVLSRRKRTTRASFTEDYYLFQKEIEDLCASYTCAVFPFISLKFYNTETPPPRRIGYDGMLTETVMTLPQKKRD